VLRISLSYESGYIIMQIITHSSTDLICRTYKIVICVIGVGKEQFRSLKLRCGYKEMTEARLRCCLHVIYNV
jgi:hypothetical protein